MKNYFNITRQDFMNFFRDDEQLNKLSADDKIEIFRTILIGSTDITKELWNEIIIDYSVTNFKVIQI
jgi:hypothetical protein